MTARFFCLRAEDSSKICFHWSFQIWNSVFIDTHHHTRKHLFQPSICEERRQGVGMCDEWILPGCIFGSMCVCWGEGGCCWRAGLLLESQFQSLSPNHLCSPDRYPPMSPDPCVALLSSNPMKYLNSYSSWPALLSGLSLSLSPPIKLYPQSIAI